MADKINTVPTLKPEKETPTVVNPSDPSDASEKKVEHIADRAAHKAAKTEQRYDEDHTKFSNI